jgi:hypothetical protein
MRSAVTGHTSILETMDRRNTIILVVLFLALLVGYLYLTQSRPSGTAQPSGTPSATPAPVFDFLTDNAVKFQVSDLHQNQTVVVTRQGQGWHMEQPKDSATDPVRIGDALDSIAHLDATRVLTNTSDLSGYGLITPTIEVRVTMSDTTQSVLQIGDATLDNSDYYALKGGDKQVYLISSSTVDTLRTYLDLPPYPPTVTLTPLPTLTPSITPTVTPTGTITPPTASSPAATSPPAATATP